jgi:ATP-dependent protease HslVU (ClpYQ) peptidase subunit
MKKSLLIALFINILCFAVASGPASATAIVGLIDDNGAIWFASDRLRGNEKNENPKIIVKNNMIIGTAGYASIGDFIKYQFVFPEYTAAFESFTEYLCRAFVPALRFVSEKNNWIKQNRQGEGEYFDGQIIIGYDRKIYTISSYFAVVTIGDDQKMTAIGSGGDYCLGSLATTAGTGWDALKRLRIALEVAAELDKSVSGPFDYIKVDGNGKITGPQKISDHNAEIETHRQHE